MGMTGTCSEWARHRAPARPAPCLPTLCRLADAPRHADLFIRRKRSQIKSSCRERSVTNLLPLTITMIIGHCGMENFGYDYDYATNYEHW